MQRTNLRSNGKHSSDEIFRVARFSHSWSAVFMITVPVVCACVDFQVGKYHHEELRIINAVSSFVCKLPWLSRDSPVVGSSICQNSGINH